MSRKQKLSLKKYLTLALGLSLLAFLLLFTPTVQSYLGKSLTDYLLEKRDADISFGQVFVNPYGKATFENVLVRDHQDDTLLHVREARFNAFRLRSFLEGSPNLGALRLLGLKLNIQKYQGDSLSNLAIFGAKLKNENKRKSPIRARLVQVDDALVSISNYNKPSRKPMVFDSLQMRLNEFFLFGDSMTLEVDKMAFTETNYQFKATHLSTDFSYSSTHMGLENLDIMTPNSKLSSDISFVYPQKGMRNFSQLVQIQSDVKSSSISVEDLKSFFPSLGEGILNLETATMIGTLESFHIKPLQLRYEDTFFSGDLVVNESEIGINIDNLSTNFSEWNNLLPNLQQTLLAPLERMGKRSISGLVQLGKEANQTELKIVGSSSSADIDLQFYPFGDDWRYSGFVSVDEFNLGQLLNQDNLGVTTFALDIDGQGFKFEALKTKLHGTFDSFAFNSYNYQNIDVNGFFDRGLFNGNLSVDDPSLQLDFEGSFDTFGETKNISCFAQVGHANLYDIGLPFLNQRTIFSGDIELVSQGKNADDFIGDLFIESGKLTNDDESFTFSRFTVQSRLNDGVRFVNLRSQDVLDGLLYGKFGFSQIPSMFKNALGSYFTNYTPLTIDKNQFINFNFNIRGKIASALIPRLELNDNTFIQGHLDGDLNNFRLKVDAPNLKWKQSEIEYLSLNIDNQNPLVNGHLKFDQLQSKWVQAEKFNLVNSAVNDTLFFRAEYDDTKRENFQNNLNFYFTFDDDQRPIFGIQPSKIRYRDQLWNVNSSSKTRLIFNDIGYTLEPIVFSNDSSRLRFSVEKNIHQIINAKFENVKLSDLIPPNPTLSVDGVANGNFSVRNDNEGIGGVSLVQIDDFTMNEIAIGQAVLELTSNVPEQYGLSFITKSSDSVTSEIKGNIFYPTVEDASLDLTADFSSFPAASLKKLMGTSFEKVSGSLNGKLGVAGKLDEPMIEGDLFLNQFSFDVPYLGVSYEFPQDIQIEVAPDLFVFKPSPVKDLTHNSTGEVEGKLTHNNFKNFIPDFVISSDRLLVLDTKFNPQSSYYGTAFMNGLVHVFGSAQNINFDIQGQTAPGTDISIPIMEATALDDATYIRFVDKYRSTETPDQSVKALKGLSLEFDLDVTPDALLGIVVDTETGSTLSGRGVGNILMEINSNGVFNIWGDYIALDGAYDFKNLGIIEKKFIVQPGGTIVWNGDPYAAQINMQAVYEVPGGANPTVLIETTGVNRKIPTEVTVNLNGNLLNFETPTFNIDFPNASANLRNELEYRLIDEERRQLQAISLLSQGVFISQFSLSALSTQTLTNNLFQKASGVFESIFSGTDDKMNVGLDYLQGDRNAAATVQTRDRLGLTLVTQISDRMLINGKVGVPVGGVEETVIVGDVTIEFLLNKDGSLRARIFNRENEFQYFGDDLGYTQGIGLSYKVEFDDFKSLIRKIIKKNAIL